jgi:hypothetical protein
MGLSERDRAILDFERGWCNEVGSKADAVRARFGLSSSRYYQLLGRIVDSADADVYDPLVARRIRRTRIDRRRARFEGITVRSVGAQGADGGLRRGAGSSGGGQIFGRRPSR